VGEIDDAIERADREGFTRRPPRTLKGRIGYLLKQLGSAKAVAQEIGVTPDSVNRYRRGARGHPPEDIAARIDRAGAGPLAAAGAQAPAAAGRHHRWDHRGPGPLRLHRARRHDRRRTLPATDPPPSPAYAQRPFDARGAGAGDQQMRRIIAEGFKDVYFQDGGGRAMGLSDVAIDGIDYLDLDY
jgi:hypothetical protein